MRWVVFCLLFVLAFSFASADTISVDSGGENDIGFSPNPYIQAVGPSAFACTPLTCSLTGANCDIWGDGCGGIINCGVCSSGYSCVSGICTLETVVPSPGGDTGGGGGGTVRTEGVSVAGITLVPKEISLNMAVNTSRKEIIRITNNLNITKTFSISQSSLDNMVILGNDSLTIFPRETKNLEVIFVASEQTGIFTGKINIGDSRVLVSLNVKTKLLLFDSNILVLNRDYLVSRGGKLRTKITVIPMGDKERLDVTLNYFVKDSDKKVYLTHSETVLVEDRTDFYRDFDIGNLDLGKYSIYLELVYPNGVALSSSQFEVVETTAESFLALIIFTLIVSMVIVAIVLVTLSIRMKMRKKEE